MPLILGTNSIKDTGYNVDNSLRFNGGSSDYLNRTNATPTNQLIWTFSFWVKLSDITNAQGSGNQMLLSDFGSASNRGTIFFESDDTLTISDRVSNSFTFKYVTTRLFRDVSAWYHIVINHNRTLSTPVTKVYVNGVQETSFSTSTNPSQNGTSYFNVDGQASYVGKYGGGNEYYNGYLSEVVWIDGQALDADQFGEFDSDSGIWKPIDVSGLTFGDNGFYLEFKQAGTGTNASGMGADTSGNTNHFAVNNLTAVDQSIDTCTNNFATMNPLDNIGDTTFSEGNNLLLWTATNKTNKSTIGVTTGKWYAECKAIDVNSGTSGTLIGVGTEANLASTYLSATTSGWGYRCQTGNIQNGAGNEAYGDTWAEDDIIGVALDMDNGAVYMSKNGTFQDSGDPTSGASKTNAANNQASYASAISGTVFFACSSYDTDSLVWNFGSPSFAISSGNTDGNGYGNFEYAVPSGYFALNTKNLAEYG